MRILGIDPGLLITGYAAIETTSQGKIGVHEAGVVRGNDREPLEKRLLIISEGIGDIIESTKPDIMVVEELYSHYRHPTTAILMGHARGVIYLCAAAKGIEVISYSATRIKKSLTGNGHASKHQVQQMVTSLLKLKEVPQPPDVADALAAALCHHRELMYQRKGAF